MRNGEEEEEEGEDFTKKRQLQLQQQQKQPPLLPPFPTLKKTLLCAKISRPIRSVHYPTLEKFNTAATEKVVFRELTNQQILNYLSKDKSYFLYTCIYHIGCFPFTIKSTHTNRT